MRRIELEDRVVHRSPLTAHVGKSGATLERWLLDDGSTVVVKRLRPATDLLMQLTHDASAREYALWAAGLLEHLPEHVEHAILGGWGEPDGATVVMRDLADRMLTWDDHLDDDRCRWILRRLADVHRAYARVPLDAWRPALTPMCDFLDMFSPPRMKAHLDGPSVLPRLATRGWQLFEELAPQDVARPVLALLERPAPLVDALRGCPCTLVHGDFVVVNMAVDPDTLVLVDWSMTSEAPAAMDVARFVAGCASLTDLSREEVIEAYAEAAGAAYHEPSMRLALLAATVWLGWNKALDASEHPDPAIRERERDDLDWWVLQARAALRAGLL